MNVPLSVEFRVSLNLFVGFKLGENELDQVHQRCRGVIVLVKIGSDQQDDQNHVDKVHNENVDYQKSVLLSGCSVSPVIN